MRHKVLKTENELVEQPDPNEGVEIKLSLI